VAVKWRRFGRRRASTPDCLLLAQRNALTRKLQTHLNRYLRRLFPQAGLEIDRQPISGLLTRQGAQGSESVGVEQRRAQIRRVPFDAATRHQISLFTCHPGVLARPLDEIRSPL